MGSFAEPQRQALVGIGRFGFLAPDQVFPFAKPTNGPGRSAYGDGLTFLMLCASAAWAHRYRTGERMACEANVLRTGAVRDASSDGDRSRWPVG